MRLLSSLDQLEDHQTFEIRWGTDSSDRRSSSVLINTVQINNTTRQSVSVTQCLQLTRGSIRSSDLRDLLLAPSSLGKQICCNTITSNLRGQCKKYYYWLSLFKTNKWNQMFPVCSTACNLPDGWDPASSRTTLLHTVGGILQVVGSLATGC